MGGVQSCSSAGALLMVAAANGDVLTAQEIIRKHPRAALYHNFKDKSSPLLQAAARGHFELLQMIIEAAVMSEGPEKTRKLCIDHANLKKQTALMVACKHGHPECVEYLVSNGADPLVCDERRHNTCLHLGALYGHSECIHKLLGVRSTHTAQGRQLTIAQIPFQTDGNGAPIKFVDAHNGWGLTALHIAVFQGAVNTARALLRHGASLESVITPPRVENSPIRCAVGSNALHIAAVVGNVAMARVILEAQEAVPGLELRTAVDSTGLRPQEYAQRARNLVLVHLLDDRLPVHLLRQVWLNYSLDGGMPARHQTLGSMLQKLKLMFNLEVIAAQRNISVADAMLTLDACLPPSMPTTPRQAVSVSCTGSGVLSKAPAPDDLLSMPARTSAARSEPGSANSLRTSSAPAASAAAAAAALAEPQRSLDATAADIQSSATVEAEMNASETPRQSSAAAVVAALAAVGVDVTGGVGSSPSDTSSSAAARALEASLNRQHVLNMKAAWQLRLREINALLVMVSLLYDSLQRLVGPDAAGAIATDGAPVQRSTAHEAILDFILSMLITPRTVSAVLHSAKKLVTATVQASGTAGGAGAPAGSGMLGGLQPPATSSEAQHSMGLLLTALKAVETCLQAAAQLSEGNAATVAAAAAAGGGGQGAAAAVVAAATGVAPTARPRAWAAVDQPTAVVMGQDLGTGIGSAGDTTLVIEATATTTEATATETSTMNTALEAITPTAQDAAAVTTMEGDTADVPDAPPHSLPLPSQQPFLLDQPGHAQNTENLPVVDGASMPVIVGPYDPVQLLRSQMAAAIVPGATSAAAALATSHWSSHLHTLLAQLQWDIGIQRHRRRRQHAAQAANRATATANPTSVSTPGVSEGGMIGIHAAAAGVGGGVGPSPLGMSLTIAGAEAAANSGQLGSFSHLHPMGNSPAALAARYEILAQRADALAAAHQDVQAGLAGLAGADPLQANAVTNGALSVLYRVLSRRGDAPQDVLTASDPITEATQTTAAATATVTAAAVTSTASVGSTSAVLEWAGRARPLESTELSGPSTAAPTHSVRFSNNLIQHGSIIPAVLQPVVSVAEGGIVPHLSGQIREAEDAASGVLCTMPDIAPAGLSLRPSTAACFEDLTASRTSLNACGLVRSASNQRLGKAGAGKDGKHGGEWHGDDLGDSDSGCGSMSSDSEAGVCAICMDLPVAVMVTPCLHGVCVQCALQLTVKGRELPSCPFCRRKISGFEHKVMLPGVGAGHHRERSTGKAPATASQAPSAAALRPGMLAMDSMTESQR